MNLEKLNQWLTLVANVGVIAGLVFLAVQVRANTEANLISLYQASSSDWMQINGRLMDRDIATLLDKAFSDAALTSVEKRQFDGWVKQQLTHAAFVRRLHDAGVISDAEFDDEFEHGIRAYRHFDRFRQAITALLVDEKFRRLVLDDDGLDLSRGKRGP